MRVISSPLPWTTATEIAQVCCTLLKIWQRNLRNCRVSPMCISLNLFSFPDSPLASLLFWSPKHVFCLHPNLQYADYFSLFEKDLLFILEIITLQLRERGLCIRWLPAVRCIRGITFHSEKVIPETGQNSIVFNLSYSGVLCCFLKIKARCDFFKLLPECLVSQVLFSIHKCITRFPD